MSIRHSPRDPRVPVRALALGVALLVATFMSHPAAGLAQEFELLPAVVRSVQPAVVTVRVLDQRGREIGSGSGFFVTGGRVVTNASVFEGGSRVEILDRFGARLGTADYVAAVSSTVDLAILPPVAGATAALQLATTSPTVGERIVAIGSPLRLSNTVSEGIISAVGERDRGALLEITSAISPGSSGGPVVNRRGEVVGVAVAQTREGQNLNFAVPVRALSALVGSPAGRIAFPTVAANRSNTGPVATVTTTSGGGGLPTTPDALKADVVGPGGDLSWLPVLSFESLLHGSLGPTATPMNDGSGTVFELYRFHGTMGDTVTITGISSEFDVMVNVGLSTPAGVEEVAADDNGLVGSDAVIVLRLPQTGNYVVMISNFERGETGTYKVGLYQGDATSTLRASHRWVLASTAASGQFSVEVDQESLRMVGRGSYQFWTRNYYEVVQKETWGSYDESRWLQEVDCDGRRSRTLQSSWFLTERLVNAEDFGSGARWQPWVPESVGQAVGAVVCGIGQRVSGL